MNLQEQWQLLQNKSLLAPELSAEAIREAIRRDSQGPIHALQRALRVRLFFVGFFLAAGGILVGLSWPNAQLMMLAGGMLGYYLLAGGITWGQLLVLQRSAGLDRNLRQTLEIYYRVIRRAMLLDEIIGLFMYPIAIGIGFFYAQVQHGDPIVDVLQNPRDLLILLVVILVISPFLHIFTRWANRRTFSNYLAQLRQNLELLR